MDLKQFVLNMEFGMTYLFTLYFLLFWNAHIPPTIHS